MIISRAPLRISFLGGGTDYPEYFEKKSGAVILTAIDKFTYITLSDLKDLFDHKIRLSYSKTELVENFEELQHKAVKEALRKTGIKSHIEINTISDLPARTGLGSSGSFLVALLKALYASRGIHKDPLTLALESIHIEKDVLCDYVGCQDQVAAAMGGFNKIEFHSRERIVVEPIALLPERQTELESSLMLFYTGLQRSASAIAEEQVKKTEINGTYLDQMMHLVKLGMESLRSDRPLKDFGELMHEGWKLKHALSSKISNSIIDELYKLGLKNGAIGGKLLGAGGGGFILFFCPRQMQPQLRLALKKFREVKFKFEPSGTQIVYHQHSPQ